MDVWRDEERADFRRIPFRHAYRKRDATTLKQRYMSGNRTVMRGTRTQDDAIRELHDKLNAKQRDIVMDAR